MTAPLRCRFAVGLSVLVLTGALSPVSASAVPSSPPTPRSDPTPAAPSRTRTSSAVSYQRVPENYALTVSPSRLSIGQRDIGTTQRITLINRGQQPLPVIVQKRNFSVGHDGTITYEHNAPYAASAWVTVQPRQLRLEPGKAQVVLATVKAPAAREPGDHQMALVFLVPAGHGAGNVRLNRGVGIPVYITAPGPVVDAVFLDGLHARGFVAGGPVAVTATVHNTGTVHHDFRAPSPLTVKAPGRAQAFPDFTVPRGSTRDIATTWAPPFLCICHPTVTLTTANGGQQTQTVQVIVFPWPWFAGALAGLLLAIVLVRLLRRRYHTQVLRAAALHNEAGAHHAPDGGDG